MKASDVVHYQGKPLDRLTDARLRSLNKLVRSPDFGSEKSDITLVQGIGGAGASAGTHTTGAAYDITAHNQRNRCYGGRLLGGTDSHRTAIKGVWAAHIHAVTAGAGYAAPLARQQVTAYWAGRNGLANNGKDTGPRLSTQPLYVAPWEDRGRHGVYYLKKAYQGRVEGHTTTKAKGSKIPSGAKFTVIAVVNVNGNLWAINSNGVHVPKSALSATKPGAAKQAAPAKPATPQKDKSTFTVGSFNFPDKTKIKGISEADRVERAVAQIEGANIDLLGVNELVGRDSRSTGSDLAERLAKALGGKWDLIVPTTDANENYFLRRKATTDLVKQYDDAVIRGLQGGNTLPGRHVSLVTVGTPLGNIDVGLTHLVENNLPGAEIQSALAGKALAGLPSADKIMLGDMNTPGPLAGLTRHGLHNTRMAAKTNVSRSASTYARYDKSKVDYDARWIIDHIWATTGLTPENYTAVLDADSNKKFHLPRASDHLLIHVNFS